MTDKEYKANLKAIQQANAQEPLLPVLRRGYSPANVLYMTKALQRLSAAQAPADDQQAESADDEQTLQALSPVMRELYAEKGRLFRERAKLSNQFHDCRTDQERQAVSKSILALWDQIQSVERKIDFLERNGALPEGEERFYLPDDPILLMKKLHSIRTAISAEQKKLRDLALLPDDDPEKKIKIQKAQDKLAELKLYRGHAEQKTQSAIQP